MATRYLPTGAATTGFAVIRRIAWWPDDLDYVVTGHLGPRRTRTPIGMPIYQPRVAPGNEAGTVEAVGRMHGFADVARVGIANRDVVPYIHIGGGSRIPVRSWRDAHWPEWVSKSGAATGDTQGRVVTRQPIKVWNPALGSLQNQVLAAYASAGGDSGSPVFLFGPTGGVYAVIVGIHWGRAPCPITGIDRATFSPISGIMTELSGWEPHTK